MMGAKNELRAVIFREAVKLGVLDKRIAEVNPLLRVNSKSTDKNQGGALIYVLFLH